MSYSNVDRPADQPTAFPRGVEGNINKHEDLSDRTDRKPVQGLAEKAEERMGLGITPRDHHHHQDRHQDHPHTGPTRGRDHAQHGLQDETDGTHLGDRNKTGPFADHHMATRTDEQFTLQPGLAGRHQEHPLQSQPGQDIHHREQMDDYKGDGTRVGQDHPDAHQQRCAGGVPKHPERDLESQEHRTFPDGVMSTGRGGAGNFTEPRAGLTEDEERYRTFPTAHDNKLERAAGHVGATGNVTHSRTDMRDDEHRHNTHTDDKERDVMSTGSRNAGKVMDEGHNAGMRDNSDRHGAGHAVDAKLGSAGRGNVHPSDTKHVGTEGRHDDITAKDTHPHSRHHDRDPHQNLHRTDDRVLKGDEHHKLPGAGKEPYYGEAGETKLGAGQHAQPGQGHVTGTGATGQAGHVGMGDKIRGTMEQMAGKLMDDPAKEQKGAERKQGMLNQPESGRTGAHGDHY